MYKYKFTGESKEINGHILHRIIATRDFGDVKKGDLGGFIEHNYNLHPFSNCWVYDEACVYGNAFIRDNARIRGSAIIGDYATIGDDCVVYDHIHIGGESYVGKSAAIIFGLKEESEDGNVKKVWINEDI